MSFSIKARVTAVEPATDGSQVKVAFNANYTDPVTGERVNEEWAKYTPAFSQEMWVKPEVIDRDSIEVGQCWTFVATKDQNGD